MKCFMLVLILASSVLALDLEHSGIRTVTDEERYNVTHPEKTLVPFNKVPNVKGNYVFTAGKRIDGDRLIVTFLDKTQYTKAEDIEVEMKYPAKGQSGATITCVEIYVNLSSQLADAFFTDGGIDKKFAEILLTCDQTLNYTYELFIYGY